ncbi:DUF3006 domain-containing protein [Myxococcota bacterium]|nr:DUF3006 domain-containing protein [Myxococcota bacterium]
MDRLVVDAFEGDLARVELAPGRVLDLPRAWLPRAAREGDHVAVEVVSDGTVRFAVDAEATANARRGAGDLLDSVAEEPPDDFRI